jgi:hypothetical protein
MLIWLASFSRTAAVHWLSEFLESQRLLFPLQFFLSQLLNDFAPLIHLAPE